MHNYAKSTLIGDIMKTQKYTVKDINIIPKLKSIKCKVIGLKISLRWKISYN